MKNSNTQSQVEFIDTLQLTVERHLSIAISTFQNLSQVQLNQGPPEGGWSIAQCLDHLNSYASYYHPLIEIKMDAYHGKMSNSIVKGWLGTYFTDMVDPDKSQKRYKAAKIHQPPQQLNAHATVASFIQHQEELMNILEKAKGVNLNEIMIPISIATFLKIRLVDAFSFLTVHNERHIRQAQRLL